MPALQKPPARLPRFVPHTDSGTNPRATAGGSREAGTFLESAFTAHVPSPRHTQHSEALERLAHDARNVLSSLLLYGDLLSAPGILTREHAHLAPELEGMTKTAVQLMERILDLATPTTALPAPSKSAALPSATSQPLPTVPVTDLAAELRHLQPLLAAIAGPSIKLFIATMPCAGRTRLAVEDLARILVNLVRNAADAMPSGGHIRIAAQYGEGHSFLDLSDATSFGPPSCVLLTVSDTGPGIPAYLRDKVFNFGFTTQACPAQDPEQPSTGWPSLQRRGLGLSTVRHLIESAGGTVRVAPAPPPGARFEINIPLNHSVGKDVTSGTYRNCQDSTFGADSAMKGRLECR